MKGEEYSQIRVDRADVGPASVPGFPATSGTVDESTEAQRLLSIVVARQARHYASTLSVARVKLSPQQLQSGIKSKVVGREGRNIAYFEEQSGVDLLLNEEPDALILSSFDPFRREVARVAMETLVRDGRIQPTKIEETLAQARILVDQNCRKAGESAILQLQLAPVHPAIVRVLGTLQYRHSFGQNQLEHAIETAFICGGLAGEMKLDVASARRAGLLHDLGKGLDQTHDAGHAQAGAEFARRFGENDFVVQAIAAHHEEVSAFSWLDHLVIAADAISAARPGARKGSTQVVLDRVEEMERIASEVPGVKQAFAVRAGREIRVLVDPDAVQDAHLTVVADQISELIRSQVIFAGQIKISVLRERRAEGIAQR